MTYSLNEMQELENFLFSIVQLEDFSFFVIDDMRSRAPHWVVQLESQLKLARYDAEDWFRESKS